MSTSTKTLLSFMVGVATGTAIGLLFAPEKGEVTRDRLAFRLSKYREQLKSYITDLIERGDEVAMEIAGGDSKAKAEGQKVVDEARKKAERLLEDVESLMSQIQSRG